MAPFALLEAEGSGIIQPRACAPPRAPAEMIVVESGRDERPNEIGRSAQAPESCRPRLIPAQIVVNSTSCALRSACGRTRSSPASRRACDMRSLLTAYLKLKGPASVSCKAKMRLEVSPFNGKAHAPMRRSRRVSGAKRLRRRE